MNLKRHDPGWAGGSEFKALRQDELKVRAVESLDKNIADMAKAQELLYATDCYSVLIVFQAMDAAGKDGTIKHVMSGVNPQGCQVFSFKRPSDEELDHNFLWRYRRHFPNAAASASSTVRITRTCSSSASTPRFSRARSCPREARPQILERALRRHQRVRAPPDPEWDAHPEVLPPSLEEGAEEALRGLVTTRTSTGSFPTPI